ncbi:MAG: IS1182 family transposase, partial [Sporomusa sp.]
MDIETWMDRPVVEPDSIYGLLANWGERLIKDDDFAQLYSETGRPCVSPALLSKVLLLMYHDNVTDREAEERAKYDLRWKAALQLPIQEHGFDHTALCRFRTRLLVNHQQKKVFQQFLLLAKESGVIKDGSLQIIDSTNILGAAAVKDTYTLIKTAVRKLLAVSQKKQGQANRNLQTLNLTLDYSKKEKEDIDWDSPDDRQQHLQSLVNDSRALLGAISDTELSQEEQAAVEILATVTEQDIEVSGDGKISLRQGVAEDRIISVQDTEMRHGHKTSIGKFNGHKGQLMIDEKTEIITNIDVTPGNQADADAIAGVLKDSLVKPGLLIGDTAYGTLAAREAMEEQEVVPVAPLPMGKAKPGKLNKYDFEIDWEIISCRCPGEQSTEKTYKNKQGVIISFVFNKNQCNHCSLQDQCTKHGKGKVVAVHPQEQKRRDIIEQTKTPEFKELYRKRAKVERKIAHVVRRGIRKTRYIGKAKTLIQLAFTSAGVNL